MRSSLVPSRPPKHGPDCTCFACRAWRREQDRKHTLYKAQQRTWQQEKEIDRLRGRIGSFREKLEAVRRQNRRLEARLSLLSRPVDRAAAPASDWAAPQPLSADMSLSAFYESYYRVAVLGETSAKNIETYDAAVKTWMSLTGDPPLKMISVQTLLQFREGSKTLRGKKIGTLRSPNTILARMKAIQSILDKAGPPRERNRDAAGLLATVPWARRPRARYKDPPQIAPETLAAIYEACNDMREPRVPGVDPTAWWRGLLIVAHNTLLRRRSLFELEWSDVDWKSACLRLPEERLKSGRSQTVHLNDGALSALKAIQSDRDMVFPGYVHGKDFYIAWHKLLTLAGVPFHEHFGLHALRANSARLLFEVSPAAAQMTLGHRNIETTIRHYVNGQDMTTRALDGLPPALEQRLMNHMPRD